MSGFADKGTSIITSTASYKVAHAAHTLLLRIYFTPFPPTPALFSDVCLPSRVATFYYLALIEDVDEGFGLSHEIHRAWDVSSQRQQGENSPGMVAFFLPNLNCALAFACLVTRMWYTSRQTPIFYDRQSQ